MNTYAQNAEDIAIQNYFGLYKGVLLSIGENDGRTFSNALALIEKGWEAVCAEPSPSAFDKLCALHKGNAFVLPVNVAIGTENCAADFYDMGAHVGNGDTSLLSTLKESETKRWVGTEFTKTKVRCVDYATFLEMIPVKVFDFISLDAEGLDIAILRQIDLSAVKCLCIEWNGNEWDLAVIRSIVPVEMKEIYRSLENVIFAR
jgi:FkbM family methyltransferase